MTLLKFNQMKFIFIIYNYLYQSGYTVIYLSLAWFGVKLLQIASCYLTYASRVVEKLGLV